MPKKDREWINRKAKFMNQRLSLRFTFFHELIIFNNLIHVKDEIRRFLLETYQLAAKGKYTIYYW